MSASINIHEANPPVAEALAESQPASTWTFQFTVEGGPTVCVFFHTPAALCEWLTTALDQVQP